MSQSHLPFNKEQLFETLETDVTLPTLYWRTSCKINARNITNLFTGYKVGNNLMFPSKGADAILV